MSKERRTEKKREREQQKKRRRRLRLFSFTAFSLLPFFFPQLLLFHVLTRYSPDSKCWMNFYCFFARIQRKKPKNRTEEEGTKAQKNRKKHKVKNVMKKKNSSSLPPPPPPASPHQLSSSCDFLTHLATLFLNPSLSSRHSFAASTLAGLSSLGLLSIEMIESMIVSTVCTGDHRSLAHS